MGTNQQQKLQVLHLPKWYPDKFNPTFGIFIQKHILSTADKCFAIVLYVCPDPYSTDKFIWKEKQFEGIIEYKIYYSTKGLKGAFSSINKLLRYWKANMIGIKAIINKHGKPNLCHVHVLNRPALLALWLKWKMGIDYIISEHWSGYFQESPGFSNPVKKLFTRFIISKSSYMTTVSNYLKNSMIAQGLKNKYKVINNIIEVDQSTIISNQSKTSKFKIVCLARLEDHVKNISSLISVIIELIKEGHEIQLDLIGVGKDRNKLEALAGAERLNESVIFHGKILNHKAKEVMSKADCLVLNSNYESFGVAPIEALSVGVPIIVTDCGGPSEYFQDDMGLIIPKNDTIALKAALIKMKESYKSYDSKNLRSLVIEKFNSEFIGSQFIELYEKISNT